MSTEIFNPYFENRWLVIRYNINFIRWWRKFLQIGLKWCFLVYISNSQSAFVPGRLITDNILIAFEITHYLKHKSQGKKGVATLKVDISKAYDRLEWRFLSDMLHRFGFNVKWIFASYHMCFCSAILCFREWRWIWSYYAIKRSETRLSTLSIFVHSMCGGL